MGSPESEKGSAAERPQHKVAITRGFWLMSTTLTNGTVATLVKPSFSERDLFGREPKEFPDRLCPKTASWGWFQNFISLLEESAVAPYGWRFALPTEAQWEYACRA